MFYNCLLYYIILNNIFFCIGFSAKAEDFIGESCTLSGSRNYKGICKFIQDCPFAISNLRAGISPSICVFIDKAAVVCCPTESRISADKCREYAKKSEESSKILNANDKATVLLPLLGVSESDDENKDVDKNNNNSPDELPTAFIVRGSDAGKNEFPHMVALGFQLGQKLEWLCGGTLISDQYVLTAAHCVQPNRQGKLTKVLLGDINLKADRLPKSHNRVIKNVKEIIIHPNYKSPFKYYDLSIIKLDSKVKLSSSIKPACLPQPKDRLELVSKLTALGWGLTEFAGAQSEVLQFVELTRFSQQNCNKEYNEQSDKNFTFPNGITSSMFCAGDRSSEMKDTCEGDSGGGLVVKSQLAETTVHYLIGITSFGTKYCGYGTPGVYVNVQSYLDYIEQTVWPS